MTKLSDVLDVAELEMLIENGYVRKVSHLDDPSYQLFNYTHRAVGVEWTPTLRECRGLIVKVPGTHLNGASMWQDARVLARPFAKFFNSTEPQSSWLAETPGYTYTIAMDKSDGSLGIAYLAPDGLPAIATRGSFSSDQAIHATALLRSKYPEYKIESGYTELVEIIFPENRIVLDYQGLDDLIYLGFRVISSGETFPAATVTNPGNFPVAETLSNGTLAEALAVGSREQKEGMVLYVHDGKEFRLAKIKEESYVQLHRIVTGLNERVVWEEFKEGRFGALVENLPAEHAEWARNISSALALKYLDLINDVTGIAYYIKTELGDLTFEENRKEFALKIIQHKEISSALFLFFQGKTAELKEWAWQQIRPEAAKPRTLVKEEA